jgi:hypothetical protein
MGLPPRSWYDFDMHSYLVYWAVTFFTLGLSLIITAIIYQSMGDGLDLNGWIKETITALIVSAGQAGGYLLQQQFPMPHGFLFRSHNGQLAGVIFLLSLWLGYKLTHLTSWDWLEYFILAMVQSFCVIVTIVISLR